jgi:FlaG/FlaF family flagellin (archaellin)
MTKRSSRIGRDSRAVSPAVGVALLFAVSIVIAAVIGAYVMGERRIIRGDANVDVKFDQISFDDVDVQLLSTGMAENESQVTVSSETCKINGKIGGEKNFTQLGEIIPVKNCPNDATITVFARVDGQQYTVEMYDAA